MVVLMCWDMREFTNEGEVAAVNENIFEDVSVAASRWDAIWR
jgi:hypothetical protein